MPRLGQMPDAIGSAIRPGDNAVQVVFEYAGGEVVTVELDQPRLLQLIAVLNGRIERGPQTPIALSRLRPGSVIQQESVSFSRQPTGQVRATFGARFEDRHVTLAFDLSKEALADLDRERG